VNEETLPLDEIETIGPGGSFVGTKHARTHDREFRTGDLFDRPVRDRRAAEGERMPGGRLWDRVAGLLAGGRPFRISAVQEAGLQAILNEVREHAEERTSAR